MDDPEVPRDDEMAAYLRALSSGAVSPRPPIAVTDLVMPPLTQFFNESPAPKSAVTPSAPVEGGTLETIMLCTEAHGAILVQVRTIPAP